MRSVARASGGFIVLCALCIQSFPAVSAADETGLTPGTYRADHLAVGQHRHFHIALARGKAVELSLVQRDATLRLRCSSEAGAASATFQNDAGRAARVRMTLVADAATVWHIEVSAAAQDASANYQLSMGPVHAATDADRQRAGAERALASAEALRREAATPGAPHDTAARDAKQAVVAYEQALRLARAAEDNCMQLMAHADLARLQYATADYSKAVQSAQAALHYRCGADADASAAAERGVAERTLGSALGYTGDLIDGTSAQEHALALYRQTGDAHFQAMALGNLSADYRVLGETHKALDAAQRALHLAEAGSDKGRALFVRESIAAIHLQRGELAPARDGYIQTIADLRSTPDPMLAGMAWNDLGLLYRELGDDDQSLHAYRSAEVAWKASGNSDGLSETRVNEAEAALDRDDVNAASTLFETALAYYSSHDRQRERAHVLGGLGRCAIARGNWTEARRRLLASRDGAHAAGAATLEIAAYLALGDLDLHQRQVAQASHDYAEAHRLSRAAHDLGDSAAALAGEAHAAQQAGRLSKARRLIEDALDIVEDRRAQITEPMLATEYFSTQRAYYDRAIDIMMDLAQRHPGRGNATAALQMSERARARSLQELLARRTIRIEKNLDPALLDAEQTGADTLRVLAWRLAQLPAAAPASEHASLQRQIDTASIALDDARGRVRAASPRYAEFAHPKPLTLEAIMRLLDDNAIVLDYWLSERHSYVWTISRHGVRASVLPPRQRIDALARALRTQLVTPGVEQTTLSIEQLAARERDNLAATRKLARTLGQIVLGPLVVPSGAHLVAVIADGRLQQLPFAVLDESMHPAGTNATQSDFVYLPSIETLRGLRELPTPTGARTQLAVFADPVFRANDPRLDGHEMAAAAPAMPALRSASEADISDLPALPHSGDEAREIAAINGPARVREALSFDANRNAVIRTDWSRYAVVHFATHALLNGRHPDLSGIVLSLYDRRGHPLDGFLRMNDIYNLRMPVDLVVLSVCDSALGTARSPDGMFSLSRAFFYAGARRVVASLWPVDDRASAAFMAYFYRALLLEHRSPADALADAQGEMRRQARWRQPFYWGGFVLQGDWRNG